VKKSHRYIRLSEEELQSLARLPITTGSLPYARSSREAKAFRRFLKLELIVGYPGAYAVRWGWLSKRQYSQIELYRRVLYQTDRLFVPRR
jgi:hypothetical protein